MKTRFLFAMALSMACTLAFAQTETVVTLETPTGVLEGTLMLPGDSSGVPVALLIAGSGPTDRDGNNPAMQNNSLKMLATALAEHGIASLRYDKRGIGTSQAAGTSEAELRFEHYISDADGWIQKLAADERFSNVVVIGHSEGSLIGMVASQEGPVDKFVSIAGPGRSADKTLKAQLASQPPQVLEMSLPIIDKLAAGQTVDDVNPMLYALFRPSVQPYMISWFRYDPAEEIGKMKIPVLVVQGTTDIQVSVQDAALLAAGNGNAQTKIIDGMNHVFKRAPSDRMKNIETYNQPGLPIEPELTATIVDFIKK